MTARHRPAAGCRARPAGPRAPALVGVAHGSRDARHAAAVRALLARVRAAAPGVRVEEAFLDHCGPRVPEVLARLASDGVTSAVAVPLLLTPAFHARTDVPAVLAAGRQLRLTVRQAPALGPSPLLTAALGRRLREAGVRPGDTGVGLVLAWAGSTDPAADAVVADAERAWRRTGRHMVTSAFASARGPAVGEAVEELRARGARRVVVGTYLLAPGFLPDRIARQAAEAGADHVTAPIGDTPETARLVLRRWAALAPARTRMSA